MIQGLKSRPILVLSLLLGAGGLLITGFGDSAPESRAESSADAAPVPGDVGHGAAPAGTTMLPEARPEQIRTSSASRGCLTDEAAIEDLKKARLDLEAKRKEIAEKDNELKAREKALQERLAELERARDEIKAAQVVNDSAAQEKIARLVETFEGMSPKAAASVVAGIDDSLAVKAMSQVSSQKLGKILSALEPHKAAQLTELLAGVVRAKSKPTSMPSSVDVAATTNSGKGGENQNGNIKQQPSIPVATRQPEPALGREPASQKQ